MHNILWNIIRVEHYPKYHENCSNSSEENHWNTSNYNKNDLKKSKIYWKVKTEILIEKNKYLYQDIIKLLRI